MIQVGSKIWIDAKFTYYVAYYYDETKTMLSVNDMNDYNLLQYIEFPCLSDAKEYIQACIDVCQDADGRFLFQIIEHPIEKSIRFTNELPLEFNYN